MDRDDPESVAAVAARVLSERSADRVRLRAGEAFRTGGSLVVRCHTVAAPPELELPRTVIAKCAAERYGPYNPDSAGAPNAAHALFNDWAAAEFLGSIAGAPALGPIFYGGSRSLGVVVLEDLGEGEAPTTREALLGGDRELAEATIVEHAALLGRLHAATTPCAGEYRRIREVLGPLPKAGPLFQDPWSEARLRAPSSDEVDDASRRYQEVLAAVGLCPRPSLDEEVAQVARAVEYNPGSFLAFCKGDQNLADDYIRRDGKPRLFDFGAGGLRHALVEGMPGRMTWGCMMRIPRDTVAAMERAYRSVLARACPEAADDGTFRRALAQAGARWHVMHVVHRLPEAMDRDRPRGPTTLRQQLMAGLASFAELAEEVGLMPALGESARELHARLRGIWPPEAAQLPYYPAFEQHAATHNPRAI